MKNFQWKKILPHVIAVVVFAIVAMVYCKPTLEGKTLQQLDVNLWKSMAQNSFNYKEKHGHFPLWSNAIFSGMPAFQITSVGSNPVSIVYIGNIITATDSKGKLAFTKTRDVEMRSVAMPVTLGVMPDYGYTGTCMRIDGISKGKTAERIGLQAGDVLLQIGEYKFVDVQTYMQAMQHFHKGEKTTLRIKRGDKEITFDVEL